MKIAKDFERETGNAGKEEADIKRNRNVNSKRLKSKTNTRTQKTFMTFTFFACVLHADI